MKELTRVEGFKKGDKIKMIEVAPISIKGNIETKEFISVMEITRVNTKTYTFTYIEGPYKGSGAKWIKGYDLTQVKNKKYYLMEG